MRNIIINSGTFTAKEGDIAISSVGNVILQAAQDSIYDAETQTSKKKSWGGLKKKVTITSTTEDIRNADPVTLIGNNVSVNAGDNIISYATDIKAPTGQVSLQAGDAIRLMAVDEVDNKNVDVKKTSSFIGIKYNKSHTNDTRNVSSELPSTLVANIIDTGSGDDTYLQGTEFEYLQGANIKAGVGMKAVPDAKIIFDTINTTVQENHTREFNNVVWQSMSEKGFVDETGTLPKFTGPTTPSFSAPGGLIVQVPLSEKEQADSTNLVNVVNRMGNQPGFEYLQEIAKRQDVDFSVVQTAQKEWDYKQEGLTPAGAALLTIAVAWAAGPAASGISSSLGGGVAGATGSAAFTSLATQASVLLVNNKGDINKTLKQLASSQTVRATLTAALTAGALQYVNTSVMPGVLDKLSIEDAKSLQGRLVSGAFEGTTSALVDTAINGGSLEDNLKNALLMSEVNAAHGFAATQIKMAVNNDILRIISQSVAGCVAGEIQSGQCGAGAIGSGVGETVAEYLLNGRNPTFVSDLEKERILTIANFASAVTAAYSGYDANIAIQNSTTTVLNNSYKDKAIEKLNAARKFLDEKSQKALDDLVAAYKKGDIELAKKYKSQLDDAIANWASSGNYEVLGVNPKAAVGAAVFAVGELLIPTNVVDVIPVGKLGKAGKALGAISPEIKIFEKLRTIKSPRYAHLTDSQLYQKFQYTMTGQKISVANGKTFYISPDKKDFLIFDPNNPMGGTMFPNDRNAANTNNYINNFIKENGGIKW